MYYNLTIGNLQGLVHFLRCDRSGQHPTKVLSTVVTCFVPVQGLGDQEVPLGADGVVGGENAAV